LLILTCFDGDEGDRLRNKQHEVYNESLDIITRECDRLTQFAKFVCQDRENPTWGKTEPYNHKNLQDLHDILAATFRFYNNFEQLEIFHSDKKSDPVTEWHGWLCSEIRSWIDYPQRVRWVQQLIHVESHDDEINKIVEYFNNDLTSHFYEVPWRKDTHYFGC
jgi:hypothetical protein